MTVFRADLGEPAPVIELERRLNEPGLEPALASTP